MATLLALLLAACGGAEPAPTEHGSENESVTDPEPPASPTSQSAAGEATPTAASVETDARPSTLSVRVALLDATIPAMTEPQRMPANRFGVRVFVRGAPGTVVTRREQLSHEMTWTLTAADGTVWEPMFLPPPMPRPGGPLTETHTLDPDGEAPLGEASSISGFRHRGSSDWQPGLPAGTYELVVGDINLGDAGRHTAPPVTLTVR